MIVAKKNLKAEILNITEIISHIPKHSVLHKLSILELAGTASMLQSVYNGFENILKQCFIKNKIKFPSGNNWHKELIELSVENKILKLETYNMLKKYLAFRHFFIHSYAMDVDCKKDGTFGF